MALTKGKKSARASRASTIISLTPVASGPNPITLGDEESLSVPTPPPEYPSPAIHSTDTPLQSTSQAEAINDEEDEEEDEKKEGKQLIWSAEMLEQLVETLLEVFTSGGAADNSFKKATYEQAATAVRRAYSGPLLITWEKCKNKWQDLKAKWAHWVILSEQSGGGFDEESELFDFYDPVWQSLNNTYPKIIWHKKNVMPFREELRLILSNVQANGQEAFTLEDPTPSSLIDPRLRGTATPLPTPTPAPAATAATSSTKQSRITNIKAKGKRLKEEEEEEAEETTTRRKKVDLGQAISAFSEELARDRKAKELFLTIQQKAVQLLEQKYMDRLDMLVFIEATELLQDEKNAGTFLILQDVKTRDRWLELKLHSELLPQQE